VKKENSEILDVRTCDEKRPAKLKWALKHWDVRVRSRFKKKLRFVASHGLKLSR
jgi:hypothetical protein